MGAIVTVSFIGVRNQSTERKPLTCLKSPKNFYHIRNQAKFFHSNIEMLVHIHLSRKKGSVQAKLFDIKGI